MFFLFLLYVSAHYYVICRDYLPLSPPVPRAFSYNLYEVRFNRFNIINIKFSHTYTLKFFSDCINHDHIITHVFIHALRIQYQIKQILHGFFNTKNSCASMSTLIKNLNLQIIFSSIYCIFFL